MEKLKACISDGTQIRELMKDLHFQDSMKNAQVDEYFSFILVVRIFLKNY